MLRLKGETDDALQDDRLRADLDERDQITSRDAFPDDDQEWVDEDERPLLPSLPFRGLAIAGACFVPTFLLVFFGVPYLLAPEGPIHAAIATVRGASETPPAVTSPTAPPPVTRSEPPRSSAPARPAVEPPLSTAALPDPPKASEPTSSSSLPAALPPSSPRSPRTEPPASTEPRAPEATREPSLPPSSRRAAAERRSGQEARVGQETRSSQEARSGSDSRGDARVADSRVVEAKPASRDGRDWTPAAAFTDRAAASRLASSIEKQGYPVEIRQDGTSSRPWVVWIGAQPSGGSRRR